MLKFNSWYAYFGPIANSEECKHNKNQSMTEWTLSMALEGGGGASNTVIPLSFAHVPIPRLTCLTGLLYRCYKCVLQKEFCKRGQHLVYELLVVNKKFMFKKVNCKCQIQSKN